MFDGFFDFFSFILENPFICRALAVGVLIALSAALLGVVLVLKRFSFIGDGLSHVAFGTMAIASVIGLSNNLILVLPVTILSAILLLRTGQSTKIKGDAAIAMISVGALAVGYLVMSAFSTSSNFAGDVCGTLFGSVAILTLSDLDVYICLALSLVVIVFFLLFRNKIFAVTFDESFAKTAGVGTSGFNLTVAVISAVIIVLAMNLVGSLLTSALIIFPALSSMRVFKTFRAVVISTAVVSVSCALVGILLSILLSTPVGSTVVAANILVFAIFWAVGRKA
ncbi:MAG: metal ABC transporter permease [Clostridia bacterium]|nr:metal ABC transporter permease [Clostridia bacterium]